MHRLYSVPLLVSNLIGFFSVRFYTNLTKKRKKKDYYFISGGKSPHEWSLLEPVWQCTKAVWCNTKGAIPTLYTTVQPALPCVEALKEISQRTCSVTILRIPAVQSL